MGYKQQYLLEVNRLPEEIFFLLKHNLNSNFGSYRGFLQYLEQFPFLMYQFKKSCRDIDPEGRIAVLYKSLGWQGILIRICNIFYPGIEEQVKMGEIMYSPFSIDGNYRYLLPWFYSITENNLSINEELGLFLSAQETLDYFKILRKRTAQIDYLLIALFLFESFRGHAETIDVLRKQGYAGLYSQLKDEEQNVYMESLLHYSYSINDQIFFEDMV